MTKRLLIAALTVAIGSAVPALAQDDQSSAESGATLETTLPEDSLWRTTPLDVRQQISDGLESVGDFSADQRADAVGAMRSALNDLDTAISDRAAALRENWPELSDAARAEASASLEALQDARTQLAERFGALQVGADDAWAELMAGVGSAVTELRDAWVSEDAGTSGTDAQ